MLEVAGGFQAIVDTREQSFVPLESLPARPEPGVWAASDHSGGCLYLFTVQFDRTWLVRRDPGPFAGAVTGIQVEVTQNAAPVLGELIDVALVALEYEGFDLQTAAPGGLTVTRIKEAGTPHGVTREEFMDRAADKMLGLMGYPPD